jgi:uncharacterized RDD family membrane protein YckC
MRMEIDAAGEDPVKGRTTPYASFTARVRALVIDSAVVAALIAAVVFLDIPFSEVQGSGPVLLSLLLATLLLYEPLWVWRRGATIGHRRANIRVVSDRTGGSPSFFQAFCRYLIKSTLGLASFATMSLTRRHQAIHDRLTSTTVQVADITQAHAHDVRWERGDVDEVVSVPGWRRFILILLYGAGTTIAVMAVASIVTLRMCDNAQCTRSGEWVLNALSVVWLLAMIAILILGWQGRLVGARSRSSEGFVPPAI